MLIARRSFSQSGFWMDISTYTCDLISFVISELQMYFSFSCCIQSTTLLNPTIVIARITKISFATSLFSSNFSSLAKWLSHLFEVPMAHFSAVPDLKWAGGSNLWPPQYPIPAPEIFPKIPPAPLTRFPSFCVSSWSVSNPLSPPPCIFMILMCQDFIIWVFEADAYIKNSFVHQLFNSSMVHTFHLNNCHLVDPFALMCVV